MRTAIESEAVRIGAMLIRSHSGDGPAIQFSTSMGNDTHWGRLWTDAVDKTHYEALRRAVKRDSVFDQGSGLWVKRESRMPFERYQAERQRVLSEVVEANRKFYIEVLGGSIRKK